MIRGLVVGAIKAYRYVLSPWWGSQCRFEPTCSAYALEAVERHGCMKGGLIASRRLLCCNPWHCGGFDPVP